ncbi:cupin domain-containing protein [Herbiconiux sp.]|uniref:cupin domain-containing protein n=1 Tax=Herbiconiux sp. TaxID=1871186 RepID=UPI0025C60C45|nr:cupin domain-containing protein [Herbiconiux sp.]
MTRRPHHRTGVGAGIAVVLASALLLTGCAGGTTTAAPAASADASATAAAPLDSAAATPTPTPTPADTDAPVVVEELGKGEQDAAVDVEVEGPVQVAFRRITIKPGAGTGKHCHDGRLIAVVEEGALTHYAPIYPEGVHVYETGDSIEEGPGYVHEGKNEGTENVVLLVTYIIPAGDPLAETDLTHCDPE